MLFKISYIISSVISILSLMFGSLLVFGLSGRASTFSKVEALIYLVILCWVLFFLYRKVAFIYTTISFLKKLTICFFPLLLSGLSIIIIASGNDAGYGYLFFGSFIYLITVFGFIFLLSKPKSASLIESSLSGEQRTQI